MTTRRDGAVIVLSIVAGISLLVCAQYLRRDQFDKACAQQGGTTVFDGKSYQCLGAKGVTK